MKKILFCFISFFLTLQTISAQRDTEHWIAPYYDNSLSNYENALYLSTDSVTPVSVNIYNNNILLTTVIISKGNPRVYTVDRDLISADTPAEAFTRTTKGLYLQADRPFYCSLRIAEILHGEIITAKGKAGIGKLFYVAASPNNNSSFFNFTAGILATEDNTTVTVSWNNPAITFLGGTPTTGTSHTFTLNRGQSFIFSGTGSNTANQTGFIGAKVVADKPVTLTNGSCNGNFGTIGAGSDIIMDQSVPTNRLGSTFAMVKTLSTRPALNTEGGIIIATEDNTQIFLNGATTPAATINAGQWYRINETNYITQPGTGNHSNMYISTSQKAYLYQLIGIGDQDLNGGFNYIPPLSCLLPTTIDEIGLVNEMPGITDPINLKLNILTEAGANVLINGIPPTAAEGPYPLTGNTQWVTYAKEGITGNLTVTSTKAVTAGINGGYSTAGYGGYFAGFSSIPAITKTA
ncbi:MAG: IgGFc-binding protein, partial [Chryseobacterium sp.]